MTLTDGFPVHFRSFPTTDLYLSSSNILSSHIPRKSRNVFLAIPYLSIAFARESFLSCNILNTPSYRACMPSKFWPVTRRQKISFESNKVISNLEISVCAASNLALHKFKNVIYMAYHSLVKYDHPYEYSPEENYCW